MKLLGSKDIQLFKINSNILVLNSVIQNIHINPNIKVLRCQGIKL